MRNRVIIRSRIWQILIRASILIAGAYLLLLIMEDRPMFGKSDYWRGA